MGLEECELAGGSVSPNLRCPICTGVFEEPVFASGQPCHCTFCRSCIGGWLETHDSCPNCRQRLEMAAMVPNAMIQNFLCELVVYCRFREDGCFWTGRYDCRRGHEMDCLAQKLREKDAVISGLAEKLDELHAQLQWETSNHVELKTWVGNFLATAPPSVAALLPCSAPESTPSSSSKAFPDRKAKMKKVVKEGGKRGVERDSAAILGGLQFHCTAVEEPEGDVEMLLECLTAMNAKADTMQEDHIGKMLFSVGRSQIAVAAYVPPAKQAQLSSMDWLQVVLDQFGGHIVSTAPEISAGVVKPSSEKDNLRVQAAAIHEANNFLRQKGLLPEDSDDDYD